jgi:hypothetical protein
VSAFLADFRREILTNQHSQLVLMSIEPGDEIGEETHDVDRILAFVTGTRHNVINTGNRPLKLYTIYSPPEESPGTLHRTKAEALAAEHH